MGYYQRAAAMLGVLTIMTHQAHAADRVSYQQQIAPLLEKYCAGCHSGREPEGDFSVDNFNKLQQGTPQGPVIVAGQADKSRLLQLMLGDAEPLMPPEDEPAPTRSEIDLVRQWIEQGMQVDGQPTAKAMVKPPVFPKLQAASPQDQFVSAGCHLADSLVLGRLGRVERLSKNLRKTHWTATQFAGKVNSIRPSQDHSLLVVASGVTGLYGEIHLVSAQSGETEARFQGHTDSVYSAALSPDGQTLASGSYDHSIILWDVESGQAKMELRGHNGAIYDLDFDPTGQILATASADQTVKLWHVASGRRLDTLGQPEGEMLCVRFSADGEAVFAGGADRQLRKWRLVSKQQPAINPMLVARYAHEAAVTRLERIGAEGLLSASPDGTAKLWDTQQLRPLGEIARLADVPAAICVAGDQRPGVTLVELTGEPHRIEPKTLRALLRSQSRAGQNTVSANDVTVTSPAPAEPTGFEEQEPNNLPEQAQPVELPATIAGRIQPGPSDLPEDVDLYRFHAEAGQAWLIDVMAAREGSELDSLVEILDTAGRPVLRTRLQAVRKSYFTFRGKDGSTSDDFRLHKWEDMELDEYLYAGGEVSRLWLYPRGPDSGFKVYPGSGSRKTYFGTTPIAHALGDTAYIVRELGRDETPLPNGLPIFPIYYENDDDGSRRAGKDSRLRFSAPQTGDYLLRIRDARGFGGDAFTYRIAMRAPQPDFQLELANTKLSIPRGSGREWQVTATRLDGFDGPIRIEIEDLPPGLEATNPLIIEAGQMSAMGTIFATTDASLTAAESDDKTDAEVAPEAEADVSEALGESTASAETIELQLIAHCQVGDEEIRRPLSETLQVSLVDQTEVQVKLFATQASAETSPELEELTIRPGQTISARVSVLRNGTERRIGFGKEDSGRNLPHGAFVDNIGLNGLLIPEGQVEREFFITAAPKLKPGRRQFHLRSDAPGNPTSRPIWLNVESR